MTLSGTRLPAAIRAAFSRSLLAGCCAGAVVAAVPTHAQALVYEETFPYQGDGTNVSVAAVGWTNLVPNNPLRLFQLSGGDGAVFAWQAASDVPVTTFFYTTSQLDRGATGMAFPVFAPADAPALAFNADIRPAYDPDNLEARFAVQMNGTDWFCESTALPVPAAQSWVFATYSRAFNPAASNWNRLTLNAASASIGAVPASALAGRITGTGIVFKHTLDNGTYDFDNVRLTAGVGRLTVTIAPGGIIRCAWFGGPQIRLQTSPRLLPPLWTDVPGSLGQTSATLAVGPDCAFLRLSLLPADAGDTNGLRNTSFEADGASTQSPYGWISSGDASADSVVSGDAFAGTFSLQHSNATAFQVETSQLATNLPNGFYRLAARVKCSGGQTACYLAGNDKLTSLPPLFTSWTETIVRGISVTNGQCRVRIFSDAGPSNWCRVDAVQLIRDDIPYAFLKGGDISELPRLEYYGAKCRDGGIEKDCLQIMKDHGCNLVRIRMYNDPGNTNFHPANQLDPLGWQNPARTLALCRRAKALGLPIQLTFHYSDYWSNPGAQYKPQDWEGLSFPALSNALHTSTLEFMGQLTNAGVFPEFVSLGNEIRGGLLFPDGANSTAAGWDRFADFLKAGYAAVKAVSAASQVVIHIDKVDAGTVNYFFGNLQSRSVPFDVIGCSYYPFWTGLTTEQARDAINSWYGNYRKPVLIMETGFRWNPTTCNGSAGQLSTNAPELFPSTPQGHKDFMLKLFNDLKLVTDGHCLGDIYWDPVFICVPGQGWQNGKPNVVANTALFDFTGNALPSWDAFFYNN